MSIDISRPQIGRIYDYVLGGTFNHEVDRRAAEAVMEIMPAYPEWARQNRSFLAHVGRRWAAEGRRRVLDLGSGLPTQGHFNEHLPGAQILFVDNDPLSVAQGQQLLAYTPDMAYCEGDLRDPDALVEAAASFLGEDHPTLAVGCIGVAYFLDDDAVRALCRRLHAFCAPGSVLALSFCCVPDLKEAREAVATAVRLSGINFYSRTGEEMAALVAPWRTSPAELLVDLVGGDPSGKLQPGHPMHQSRMLGMFGER